ncbi:MAG: PAS domain S-box protein [Chloroflexi bacterium]|nr:PAS domain S-box protein [Chloroflexota bacterium]
MPDEPAPVPGLGAGSRRNSPDAHRAHDDTSPAANLGTLAPRTLARREAQRRELLEAIRTPIVSTSLGGRITGFNAAAVALFGSPARLYGRGIREVLSFVPEPLESAVGDVQGRFADATGRTLDLEVSRTVMQEAGDQGYAVYVVHDISRHAEVNRLREQLLYSVAHELRGPLMVLDNALEILHDDYPKLTTEEFTHVLGTGRRASRRMRTLMEDLLSAGSIQSGHFVVAPRHTDLSDLVAEALEIVGPTMEQRAQRIEIDVTQDAATVMADKRYARQVLTNLLANASKYSPEDSLIRVVGRPLGTMVRIGVEDQGPGIAPEQQVGLFERFYRVRSDNDAQGVGLGLAIAKGIVEAHGGSIGIDSTPRNGTSVWFTLHVGWSAPVDGKHSADPSG